MIDYDTRLMQIINTYGNKAQVDKAIEEMAELIKALLKHRYSVKKEPEIIDKCEKNVAEEIADVKIMIRQLELIFGNEDEVDKWVGYKLDRQMERLKKREGEKKDESKRDQTRDTCTGIHTGAR